MTSRTGRVDDRTALGPACSTIIGSRRIAQVLMMTSATRVTASGSPRLPAAPRIRDRDDRIVAMPAAEHRVAQARAGPPPAPGLQVLITTTPASAACSVLRSRLVRAGPPSVRNRGRSSGSRTSRSGISWRFMTFAFRLASPVLRTRAVAASRAAEPGRGACLSGGASPTSRGAFARSVSISRAVCRRPSLIASPPSMRASSSTRPSASSRRTVVRVRPPSTFFSISKCVSA